MKNKKTQINLVSLPEFLEGRKWEELSEEEQSEIVQKILKLISPE